MNISSDFFGSDSNSSQSYFIFYVDSQTITFTKRTTDSNFKLDRHEQKHVSNRTPSKKSSNSTLNH